VSFSPQLQKLTMAIQTHYLAPMIKVENQLLYITSQLVALKVKIVKLTQHYLKKGLAITFPVKKIFYLKLINSSKVNYGST